MTLTSGLVRALLLAELLRLGFVDVEVLRLGLVDVEVLRLGFVDVEVLRRVG